jgi:hypothetical protein
VNFLQDRNSWNLLGFRTGILRSFMEFLEFVKEFLHVIKDSIAF